MARYTGPKTKVSRRYGVLVHGSPKAFETRTIHRPARTKGIPAQALGLRLALAEKQKLRYQYGVLERQFRRYFQLALSKRGVTGEILLQLLETRLDNVVQKLGSKTLRAARQMVSHGHVTVNGRKTNISSMNVKAGDKVAVRSKDRSRRLAAKAVDQTSAISTPDWLDCGQRWSQWHGGASPNQRTSTRSSTNSSSSNCIRARGVEASFKSKVQRPPSRRAFVLCRSCHSSQSRLIPQGYAED